MTSCGFLADLIRRGFTLTVEGDDLRCRPASRLTAGDIDAIRARKAQLVELLAVLGTLEADCTGSLMRRLVDGLTAAERDRLRDEADTGDVLASWIVALTTPAASRGEIA